MGFVGSSAGGRYQSGLCDWRWLYSFFSFQSTSGTTIYIF